MARNLDPTATPTNKSRVTRIRHSSGKMSGSGNATRLDPQRVRTEGVTYGELASQPQSADVCYYCAERFEPGQLRWRILQTVPAGWGPALLCMDCFKQEDSLDVLGAGQDGNPAPRHTIQCAGCNEYISTIRNPRHQNWYYCSSRCYQRCYRKRRRGRASVVDWKGHRPNSQCIVCKKSLDRYGEEHKRKDAKFCSSKCRQWAYRRRQGALPKPPRAKKRSPESAPARGAAVVDARRQLDLSFPKRKFNRPG